MCSALKYTYDRTVHRGGSMLSIYSPCSAPRTTLLCKCTISAFPFRQHVGLLIGIGTEMTVSISLILKMDFSWPNKGVY